MSSDGKVTEVDIILPINDKDNKEAWIRQASKKLRIPTSRIRNVILKKRSIDSRKLDIKVLLRLLVGIDKVAKSDSIQKFSASNVSKKSNVVLIIGSGPAGLFSALEAIKIGWKPIVFERGKDVSSRRFDLAPLLRKGIVDEESNYCFGEGGAGTFSDGKLYTRSTKRGIVSQVYETFVEHGASSNILIDSNPHIGSNLLPNVVRSIRNTIVKYGGEVLFNSKMTDILLYKNEVKGIVINNTEEYKGKAVILATGHSARDIYDLLYTKYNIAMEAKSFAVGVRIEHPQDLIDSIQYHYKRGLKRSSKLPSAKYSLSAQVKNLGVHSFCMCPGGFIVPSSTKNDEVVVNGMSLSKRDSIFANSGMVVTVSPNNINNNELNINDPLIGVNFQKNLEKLAKKLGREGQVAPAQRMNDFINSKYSDSLPKTSYKPGVNSVRLDKYMPSFLSNSLRKGFKIFGKNMNGYLTKEAILLGFETRTSSPVRIIREEKSMQHPDVKGLFPCGEGAGYAGGIVSSAIDGKRCARSLLSIE